MKNLFALLLFIVLSQTIFSQVPEDGLYIYLPFNQSYADLSGNGNDASPNQTILTEDRFACPNSACYFNGIASLSLPDQARFQPQVSNSVSYWLKTSQMSRFDLIVQRIGANSVNRDNYTHIFNHPDYGLEWSYPHYNNLNTTLRNIPVDGFNDGSWHHLVFVKDVSQQKMKVYFDAQLVVTKVISDISFQINGVFTIGHWLDYYYHGAFDDFRVYDRVLSNVEIQALYDECTATCLEIDLGPDTSYCESFSHTLFAGNLYPHYLWNTGDTTQNITVSSPGVYWVKGYSNNSCESIDSIEIKLFSANEIDWGQDTTLCYGQTKTLECGDCFASFLWSTGDTTSSIEVNSSGYYWVEAINSNNDTIREDIFINVRPEITIDLGKTKYFCFSNPVVEIASPDGFEQYLWSTGSYEREISVSQGIYWLEVIDEYGCSAIDTIIVEPYSDLFYFKLFPNPASNYFIIDIHSFCFPEEAVNIEVIDMNQRSIFEQDIMAPRTQIKIPYNTQEALYIVKLFIGKRLFEKKLVVKKSFY